MRDDLRLIVTALFALSALAGCQDKKQVPVQGTAGGEVLPGSASDAMLPIDTVRSQPPLAPKAEPSGAKTGKANGPGKPAAVSAMPEAEAEAPPAAAPAAEPTAEQ